MKKVGDNTVASAQSVGFSPVILTVQTAGHISTVYADS